MPTASPKNDSSPAPTADRKGYAAPSVSRKGQLRDVTALVEKQISGKAEKKTK